MILHKKPFIRLNVQPLTFFWLRCITYFYLIHSRYCSAIHVYIYILIRFDTLWPPNANDITTFWFFSYSTSFTCYISIFPLMLNRLMGKCILAHSLLEFKEIGDSYRQWKWKSREKYIHHIHILRVLNSEQASLSKDYSP